MSEDRTKGRRASHRAFRPTWDGRLESRSLLSAGAGLGHAAHVAPLHAADLHRAAAPGGGAARRIPPIRAIQTLNYGRAVLITDGIGQQFQVSVTDILQPTTTTTTTNPTTGLEEAPPEDTVGTVRAYRMPGGRVGLIVDGTTEDSALVIDPVLKAPVKGLAHGFASGQARYDHLLKVGAITVQSGQIFEIVGYRTAVLSGPIVVGGASPVDRIAFDAIEPGASIGVGGDLNTLDVLTSLNLSGGPGIQVGRDLNWFSVGQDLALTNGSSIVVGRDIGLAAQPAKGTGPAGQGGQVNGNVLIAPGSVLAVGRNIDATILVNGNAFGLSHVFQAGRVNPSGFSVRGIVTA